MSNYRAQNVLVVDTSAAFTYAGRIESVKLIGGSGASTVTIKADDTSGAVVYQARAAIGVDNYDHDICLQVDNGFYVTMGGTGAIAYIYLE